MTRRILQKGSSIALVISFFWLTSPTICLSADDMWSSVFEYQQKMAGYGNPEAQVKLGEMYEEGHGTEQDFDQARQWYQKAANQGYEPARKKLSKLEARRKQNAETQRHAEQERIAREELERVRAEREKAKAAERAKHKPGEPKQRSRAESGAMKQQPEPSEKIQPHVLSEAEKAKHEVEARKRAQEAIKKMLSVPSAYSED